MVMIYLPTNLPYYHTKISPIDPMGLFFFEFCRPQCVSFPKNNMSGHLFNMGSRGIFVLECYVSCT